MVTTTIPENVVDESKLKDYRTELPNVIDDFGLTPYEHRLYCHYKRSAGSNGGCVQGIRYIAGICKMSTGQATKAKQKLIEYGLIWIRPVPSKSGEMDEVTLPDLWEWNFRIYVVKDKAEREKLTDELKRSLREHPNQSSSYEHSNKRSRGEQERSLHEHQRSYGEQRNKPLRNKHSRKDKNDSNSNELESAPSTSNDVPGARAETPQSKNQQQLLLATTDNPQNSQAQVSSTPPTLSQIAFTALQESIEDPTPRSSALPFPIAPPGYVWVASPASDQPDAHLFAADKWERGKCLCKRNLPYRYPYLHETVERKHAINVKSPCKACMLAASENAPLKAEAPPLTPEVKNAFAKLCKMDWAIDTNAKAMGKALREIGAKEPVTIEALRRFYDYWYKCDFRGKQGKSPAPRWVSEHWVEYTESDDCKEHSNGQTTSKHASQSAETRAVSGGDLKEQLRKYRGNGSASRGEIGTAPPEVIGAIPKRDTRA